MTDAAARPRLLSRAAILPPLAVYAVFVLAVAVSALAQGHDLRTQILGRRSEDIGHYKAIATTGYEVFPCEPPYPRGEICGNPGWFPSWPLAMRPLAWALGRVHEGAAALVVLCGALAFVLLHDEVRRRAGAQAAGFAVAALACFPGSFYLLTPFPYAFVLALMLLHLRLGERPLVAAPLALVIGATYPTACLFGLVPAVRLAADVRAGRLAPAEALRQAGWRVLPFFVGPVAFVLYLGIAFGDLGIYFKFQAQARYARSFAWPWQTLAQSRSPFSPELLTVAAVATVFAVTGTAALGAGLWAFTLALLSFSLFTGTLLSIYRHYVMAFTVPMTFGLASRPAWLKGALIGIFAALNHHLLGLYLAGRLI